MSQDATTFFVATTTTIVPSKSKGKIVVQTSSYLQRTMGNDVNQIHKEGGKGYFIVKRDLPYFRP